MALDTPFVRFLRSGGKSEFTVSLHRLNRAPERKDASFDLSPHLQRFLGLLDDADEDNISFVSERLGDTPRYDAGPLKQRAYDEFENRLSAVLAYYADEGRDRPEIVLLMEADISATEAWLLRQFQNDVNEARQRSVGVTHYIWRSADDGKVRSSHAERDDRVFLWDHRFADGLPGHAHNCRCYAEPAILNGQVILTGRPVSPDLADRISDARGAGLARAAEDVAYLDASVLLGGTAFTAGAAKLGINLTRLRPAAALNALRSRRARLDNMIDTRRREVDALVANRFAQLEAQGHGPQRHEGAVTRQMLEDRVLRGIDPITGTTIDGATGGTHTTVRTATRITNEADFVAAEGFIRRSSDYRAARDEAISRIGQLPRTTFHVSLPIEDVLGPGFQNSVEGVRRLGSVKNPAGVQAVDFGGGSVTAVFELLPTGEPFLVTLFPTGVR